ncbi:NACHT, LRR and PYD domains-containing protein 1a allele 5-like [Mantella aurantiaca]
MEGDNIISPSVHGNNYRLQLKPGHLFCCSETGIKFQVKYPFTIEYNLEYGSDYIKQIKDNGYELVGPLFNITVDPGVVTSVHLPHYLYLEGLGKDKSTIKYAHFKDGKVHFKTPASIESSYIVLENPSFSRVGALIRSTSFWTQKKKSIPISAKVLIYFCIMCPHNDDIKEYRTHLYLVPSKRADLTKLDEMKEKNGFKMIDKPPSANLIAGDTYYVTAEPNTNIIPTFLQFEMNNKIQDMPYSEINVKGNATSISLKLTKKGEHEKEEKDFLWTGELTRADLEHQSAMVKPVLEAEHFVMKNRTDLIERIDPIEPVMDYLLAKKNLTAEQYDNVCSKAAPHEKMRQLYSYVRSWGEKEKDVFQEALKKNHSKIIRDLENKS